MDAIGHQQLKWMHHCVLPAQYSDQNQYQGAADEADTIGEQQLKRTQSGAANAEQAKVAE